MTQASQTTVEQIHEAQVLRALADRGVASRSELSELIGLGRSSIAEVLTALVEKGTVAVEGHQKRDGRGRPTELLRLDREAVSAVGIDLAHGWVHLAALNVLGEPVATGGRTIGVTETWQSRTEVADNILTGLTLTTGQLRPLRGVAVGLFGPVSIADQWMTDSAGVIDPQARSRHSQEPWFGYIESLADRFCAPIMVDNTTRFAAYAEHLAQLSDSGSQGPTLHVRCFQGVGGAVVSTDGVVRGSSGLSGEIGHLTIDPEGLACRCGRRGCLETVASTPAILARCRERGEDVISIEDLQAALRCGSDTAGQVLREAGEAIGTALLSSSILLDPASIILSGDIIQLDDTVLTTARAAYARGLGNRFTSVPITPGALGHSAAAHGAGLTILHHEFPQFIPLLPARQRLSAPQPRHPRKA